MLPPMLMRLLPVITSMPPLPRTLPPALRPMLPSMPPPIGGGGGRDGVGDQGFLHLHLRFGVGKRCRR